MSTMSAETRQRPIIAAMERGPGPGKYYLPGTCGFRRHDMTRRQNPAYSFRLMLRTKSEHPSPGPAYFIPAHITRTGVEGSPKYGFHDRTAIGISFNTPAPGTYAPEKHDTPKHIKAPAYSFGSRTAYVRQDANPAPNNYNLPTIIGHKTVSKRSPPAYSMTGRSKIGSFHEDLQKTPGPGAYKDHDTNNSKRRNPCYSMLSRNYTSGDSTTKPGPGAYSPERVYVIKKQAPRFSFGIRHSEYIAPLIVDVN